MSMHSARFQDMSLGWVVIPQGSKTLFYHIGLYWGYAGVTLGVYWGYVGAILGQQKQKSCSG